MSAALKAKVRFPIEAAIDLIGAALLGAHALHEAKNAATGEALGIVHRDLSPRNLLVGRGGALKLIDLGLGKSTQQDWRTATGIVMGTMGYLSPEQAMGADVDRRADLYTLAVVLFEMLTLERYIPKGQHMSMVEAQIRPRAISARSLRPELPEALDFVLLRALSPQRDDRFATAMELRSALLSVVPEASLGDAGSRLECRDAEACGG
jgi:serine/threonine-protein kinase